MKLLALLSLSLSLCLSLSLSSACPSRQETWATLKRYKLDRHSVEMLCREKMSWYEKLLYRPEWVADKLERDCGLPLTEEAVLHKEACLPCEYRGLVGRLTP